MSWLKRLFTSPNKTFQGKCANRADFEYLKTRGCDLAKIRRILLVWNEIKLQDLAKVDGVSVSTLSNTIKGRRTSPKAQELIAQALGLGVEDLFQTKRPEPHLRPLNERGCEPARPQPQTENETGLAPESGSRLSTP